VNREAGTIQVQDRYLDSCQEWAISFAYHFSTFRIWSLFLCFRLPSLRRMAYGILMLLATLRRPLVDWLGLGDNRVIKGCSPTAILLSALSWEMIRLGEGSSMRPINNLRDNVTTFNREWTFNDTLCMTTAACMYLVLSASASWTGGCFGLKPARFAEGRVACTLIVMVVLLTCRMWSVEAEVKRTYRLGGRFHFRLPRKLC
jgi:hypothetical protein